MMKAPRRSKSSLLYRQYPVRRSLWNRCKTSFVWLRYWGFSSWMCASVAQGGMGEKERRIPEHEFAWCPAVIINPQWLTRLRTFMIHANGSAIRSTRTYTNKHVLVIHACIWRRSSARIWYVCTYMRICVCAFMALGHANLVVRSSTLEKPRPTLLSLWQEKR